MTCRPCVIVLYLCLLLEVDDVFSLSSPKPRVCIIGAGFSGLGTARHMKDYGLNFTVFEASRNFGGTWRFDPHVGIDEDGLPSFTSQYKDLRTNTPRQTMEYVGFPFPEGTPSYPTGTCFYKYLRSFVKHFGLKKHIQFRSYITHVGWAGDRWNVTYTKTDTKENVTEHCGFVVIATGQFSSPNIPTFPDQESFRGKIMHSHDYKDPEDFRNQRVLLVGAGASGLDFAVQLVDVTSKLVHSHHLDYNQPDFPENYVKRPDILHFTPYGARFVDGSTEDFDVVIFCTGYRYAPPFLEPYSSGISASNDYVLPLYQQLVNINYPTMTFVGLSKTVITRVNDAQGQYSAALAAGKFKLPPRNEMLQRWLKHVQFRQGLNFRICDINLIGNDMDNYFEALHREAGIPRAPPVLSIIRDFNAQNRLDDLLNYRHYEYKIIDNYTYERIYTPRKVLPCPIEDYELLR